VSGRPQHPLATTSLDSSPVPAPALNQPQLSEAFFRHALAMSAAGPRMLHEVNIRRARLLPAV
jgi:hypothetical protein